MKGSIHNRLSTHGNPHKHCRLFFERPCVKDRFQNVSEVYSPPILSPNQRNQEPADETGFFTLRRQEVAGRKKGMTGDIRWIFPTQSMPEHCPRYRTRWCISDDVALERFTGCVSVPGRRRFSQGHQRTGHPGRRGLAARSIFREVDCVLQPPSRQDENHILGAQRILPGAKTPGED